MLVILKDVEWAIKSTPPWCNQHTHTHKVAFYSVQTIYWDICSSATTQSIRQIEASVSFYYYILVVVIFATPQMPSGIKEWIPLLHVTMILPNKEEISQPVFSNGGSCSQACQNYKQNPESLTKRLISSQLSIVLLLFLNPSWTQTEHTFLVLTRSVVSSNVNIYKGLKNNKMLHLLCYKINKCK